METCWAIEAIAGDEHSFQVADSWEQAEFWKDEALAQGFVVRGPWNLFDRPLVIWWGMP